MPSRNPNNLFLVGFMGAGKSTVGTILASELGAKCFDTDEEIARREKMPLAQIFETKGEPHFREVERDVVAKASGIVSLGGGAFTPELLERGTCIYLRASVETLVMRLGDFKRPLFKDVKRSDRRGYVEKLVKDRQADYAKCHYIVDTDGKSPENVAKEVKAIWKPSP